MNILVAGGAGYIGSCCTEYLIERDHRVVVYDSLVKGHREAVHPCAAFVHGDIRDRELLADTLRNHDIQGVIHFAAFIEVGESMTDPGLYFDNNVGAGIRMLQTAASCGVRNVVFSSTAATYGMPDRVPIPETCPTVPINPYGESKLMFEHVLHWFHELHGVSFAALRYFNAAGATETFGEDHAPETHLIPILLQVATGQRDSISIFGDDYDTPDGTCIRDYVHVTDLAQAHLLALESEEAGSFNLGSGSGYSVRELVDVARRVTGHPIPCETACRRPGDPPRLISDSSKARRVLGWKPERDDLEAIISDAWEWKRRHPNGYAA